MSTRLFGRSDNLERTPADLPGPESVARRRPVARLLDYSILPQYLFGLLDRQRWNRVPIAGRGGGA